MLIPQVEPSNSCIIKCDGHESEYSVGKLCREPLNLPICNVINGNNGVEILEKLQYIKNFISKHFSVKDTKKASQKNIDVTTIDFIQTLIIVLLIFCSVTLFKETSTATFKH